MHRISASSSRNTLLNKTRYQQPSIQSPTIWRHYRKVDSCLSAEQSIFYSILQLLQDMFYFSRWTGSNLVSWWVRSWGVSLRMGILFSFLCFLSVITLIYGQIHFYWFQPGWSSNELGNNTHLSDRFLLFLLIF